jgi:hypothetical protein
VYISRCTSYPKLIFSPCSLLSHSALLLYFHFFFSILNIVGHILSILLSQLSWVLGGGVNVLQTKLLCHSILGLSDRIHKIGNVMAPTQSQTNQKAARMPSILYRTPHAWTGFCASSNPSLFSIGKQ